MRKVGRKTREWLREKPKLVKIYKEKGVTQCENCGSRYKVDFHHRPKRSSQKAEHTFERTRLLCWECHPFFEKSDEADRKLFAKPRGYSLKYKIDIMADKKKSKKPEWKTQHKCVHCKVLTTTLICHNCGKISVR